MSVERRILDFLFEHSPNEYNAPTLSKELGMSRETCNMALSRLMKRGAVERPVRGFYCWKEQEKKGLQDIADDEIKFHGIHMQAKLSKLEGGAPLLSKTINLGDKEKIDTWIIEGNKRVFETSWRQRRVRIEVSSANIEIKITCTDNPLSVPELDAYISFLEGLFFPDFYSYAWELPSWGINVDHTDWWIEGANSITMRDARGYIARWYNKKGIGARQEVHGFVTLELNEVINFLKGNAPMGVSDLREQVNILKRGIKELSKDNRRVKTMLTRFIEVLYEMSPEPTIIAYDTREDLKHRRGG